MLGYPWILNFDSYPFFDVGGVASDAFSRHGSVSLSSDVCLFCFSRGKFDHFHPWDDDPKVTTISYEPRLLPFDDQSHRLCVCPAIWSKEVWGFMD